MIFDHLLKHEGTKRHSGRYPWGSGKDPQRSKDFLGMVKQLKKEKMTTKEIADAMGMKTTELLKAISVESTRQRNDLRNQALKLSEKGMGDSAIGKRLGKNESTIRSLLNPVRSKRAEKTDVLTNILKDAVTEKKYIDVGSGIEQTLGVKRPLLDKCLYILEKEGYNIHRLKVLQLGTGKYTEMKILIDKGLTYKDLSDNRDKIELPMGTYSLDGGNTMLFNKPINSVKRNRIMIRYREDGGIDKDGVIELRKNVEDLSLGSMRYSQVRIGVEGNMYMKGMAMHAKDDSVFPKGVDIIYNTNKVKGTPDSKVFKSMEKNEDGSVNELNPFKTVFKQKTYLDKNGNEQISALNSVNDEGRWSEWKNALSSQFLGKQSIGLARKQLSVVYDNKLEELEELNTLTNPAVKKRLLLLFADGADSSAVQLKAAAMPGQSQNVILPITSLKPNEVYAEKYENGSKVVLIRHPHGGIFEIPELIVNNKNQEARAVLHGAKDAIGIHPSTASKLSGADFDGDTVLVIPNNKKEIMTSDSLKGLRNFDPKELYKNDSLPPMTDAMLQQQMGKISNLITDMTLKGASLTDNGTGLSEIERAVRHSMVVIDSKKHSLDYKQSEIDHDIKALKAKYQGGSTKGASTLLSKAKSKKYIPLRDESKTRIDPLTGKKVYVDSKDQTYLKGGKTKKRLSKVDLMEYEDDAFALSSGTLMEKEYALHANRLKDLANLARKEAVNIDTDIYSPKARETYSKEVESLKSKLNLAYLNKPYERKAQLVANKIISTTRENNPGMEKKDLKKLKGMALETARQRLGAKKIHMEFSQREWEAIQAGALSKSMLEDLLTNTDGDYIKALALPKSMGGSLNEYTLKRASAMQKNGYTLKEISSALGVSVSSLSDNLE